MTAEDQINRLKTHEGKSFQQEKAEFKKSKTIMSFVLGAAVLLSVFFLIYGFNKGNEASELQKRVDQLTAQLEECQNQ